MPRLLRGPVGRARLTFAVLILAGLATAGAAVGEYRAIVAPLHFAETPCTMDSCHFTAHKSGIGPDAKTYFTPFVTYHYQVEGVRHTGDTVAARPMPLLGEFARQEFADRYGPGAVVTCHRNPENPAESVLLTESDRGELDFRVSLAVVLAALGVVGWGALEFFLIPRPSKRYSPRGVITGVPDDVPENDALARTRAILRDRDRGFS